MPWQFKSSISDEPRFDSGHILELPEPGTQQLQLAVAKALRVAYEGESQGGYKLLQGLSSTCRVVRAEAERDFVGESYGLIFKQFQASGRKEKESDG